VFSDTYELVLLLSDIPPSRNYPCLTDLLRGEFPCPIVSLKNPGFRTTSDFLGEFALLAGSIPLFIVLRFIMLLFYVDFVVL
jgi:hypothetical protein